MLFVPNEGQWSQDFLYKGIASGVDFYLEKNGVTFVTGASDNIEKIEDYKEGKSATNPVLNFHAYSMEWLGGNKNSEAKGGKKQRIYHNYFLGKDSNNWKGNVPVFGNVTYEEIYPNINIYFYSESNNPKYDLIVKPGANIGAVQLKYTGLLDGLKIENGNLILKTAVGDVMEAAPYAYQYINGERKTVKCEYVLNGNVLGFKLPRGYNKNQTLIIDPTLVFATLTGSVADNWGFSATYDNAGNLYAGGIVRGAGYPTTLGAFQSTYGGGNASSNLGIDCDISITKFNAAGNAAIYSTYIGGSGNEMPHSLVIDHSNNNLIIGGKTSSNNYPVTSNAYDNSFNGGLFDIFLTKLNSNGTALIGSTFLGGSGTDGVNVSAVYTTMNNTKYNYGDDSRSEVLVDNLGNIYLIGNTQSTDFPVTSNAFKSILGGPQDGVFVKFNPNLSTMIFGSLLGGSGYDGAYSIALDSAQSKIYLSGGTMSSDFHNGAMAGAYDNSFGGGVDGFVMRVDNNTYALIKATYIGTSAYDQNFGVQIDQQNGVYIMGQTMGAFPVSSGVYSNPGSHQYIMKLDSTLSTSIYSTVYGSGNAAQVNISPVAFLVDTCQNVYISGWGGLSGVGQGSSTTGMPTTPNAIQTTTDGADFYFIVFSPNAQNLLYATFFGSNIKQEHVDGGTSRFDPSGKVYQAICASCGSGSSFPSTPGAYSTVKGGSNCNLGAVKIAFELGAVTTDAYASPNDSGCAPFTVNFQDSSTNATSWQWDFGDGGTSNLQTPSHTYTTPGTYIVRLIAINGNACITRDTSYITIVVRGDVITPNFTVTKIDSCDSQKIAILNTSTGINGGSTAGATFTWDFGDGTTYTGPNPPNHTYLSSGTYTITLTMSMPSACNNPAVISKIVDFTSMNVTANPTGPFTICLGSALDLQNTGQNASDHQWNFGDGNTSNSPNPSHTYSDTGTYTIRYIAGNPNTCNKFDTVITTVRVNPLPAAQFTFTPLTAETNQPHYFTNQSLGGGSLVWDFGDGTTSTEENPSHTFKRSGTFRVCLSVTNAFGCKATVCKDVVASIYPVVDVPSGFSPNGDGRNDILRVRGFGIEKLNLKIFNRWGEMVFETNSENQGWDGTYKGVPQEMDAYGYILVVDFFDGTSDKKQGNVTLLR